MTTGKVYVLHNLLYDPKAPGRGNLPPRLGLVAKVLEGGLGALVRLRTGGFGKVAGKWHPRTRHVTRANVVREATPRELVVGMPL